MKIVNISEARRNIFKLTENVIKSSHPVTITSRKGNVVVVSLEDWESMEETLYIKSIPGLAESIIKSANAPDEEFVSIWTYGY